jgi:hypothetical protein
MEENQVVSLEPKIGPDAAQAQLDMFSGNVGQRSSWRAIPWSWYSS